MPQTHQAVQVNDVPQTHHAVQVNDVPQAHQAVQCVIDYMKGKGIDLCCQVEGKEIFYCLFLNSVLLNYSYMYMYVYLKINCTTLAGPSCNILLVYNVSGRYRPVYNKSSHNFPDLRALNFDAQRPQNFLPHGTPGPSPRSATECTVMNELNKCASQITHAFAIWLLPCTSLQVLVSQNFVFFFQTLQVENSNSSWISCG